MNLDKRLTSIHGNFRCSYPRGTTGPLGLGVVQAVRVQNLAMCMTAIDDSADLAHCSPDVLPEEIPFAFLVRGRLRNDYKRR
jgi:hypothetical protein